MATVKFYNLLRLKLGIRELDVAPNNIPLKDLLFIIKEKVNNELIVQKLLDNEGNLRRGANIFVNGINIEKLDNLNTIINNDDTISLFPCINITA